MRISDCSSDVCSSDLTLRYWTIEALHPERAKGFVARLNALLDVHNPPVRQYQAAMNRMPAAVNAEIGRASCRERGRQYVSISGVSGSLKQKQITECLSPERIYKSTHREKYDKY